MERRTNKPGNRTSTRTTAMANPQDARKVRGRSREDQAAFPVAPVRSELPRDYAAALAEIKDRVRQERLRVVLAANSAMVFRGLSPRNLKYMRAFAGAWPDARIVQRTVAQLPCR